MKVINWVCRVVTLVVVLCGIGYGVYGHNQYTIGPKVVIDEAGNPLTPEQFKQLEKLESDANDKNSAIYQSQVDELIKLAKKDYAIGIVKPNSGNSSVASLHKAMAHMTNRI